MDHLRMWVRQRVLTEGFGQGFEQKGLLRGFQHKDFDKRVQARFGQNGEEEETVNAATLESVEFDEFSIVDEYLSEPEETLEVSLHEPDISIAQNEDDEAEKEIGGLEENYCCDAVDEWEAGMWPIVGEGCSHKESAKKSETMQTHPVADLRAAEVRRKIGQTYEGV
ncbi:hypothetical protein Scep_004913 [Stephania cephalantha]|uniref:Uncharacterized protein n=1 Tax=Stephania cephalantha TaxID=152367 RepID=A0AAP0KW87_9MAGN